MDGKVWGKKRFVRTEKALDLLLQSIGKKRCKNVNNVLCWRPQDESKNLI